ncbi:Lar family restriction alleviation protein [Burkholderia gladioli]|uniref:Lar family restriction alleviation protein n=1 Tax=Burkholderia gladioli TaxID=28095 RepID=UPI00163E0471|nr:Lar family restriction alleviation protein [Burkholderia gladioli]
MSDKLSDCPFCGSHNCTVSTRSINGWVFAYCPDCLAEGPAMGGKASAIAAWNRRASPAPAISESEWQPIETAPKDGTEIALLFADEVTVLGKQRPRVRAASWLGDWTIPYRLDNPPIGWTDMPAAPGNAARKGEKS